MAGSSDGDLMAEFIAALDASGARLQFWTCPIRGHSRGTWTDQLVQTVAWDGDVARCLAPDCGRTSADPKDPRVMNRMWIDTGYDRDRASGGVSRYGSYLNQHRDAFEALAGDGYERPAVPFAALAWRIATGPVMSPPYVRYPNRVLSARLEPSDWNGNMLVAVQLVTELPDELAGVRPPDRLAYRGWQTNAWGQFEGVGGQELARAPYLLPTADLHFEVPATAWPVLDTVYTSGEPLVAAAMLSINASLAAINEYIAPILSRLNQS